MGILTDFRLTVLENKLGLYGVHIHKDGKTLAEHRFRSDDRENLCSASKTFVAVAVGIAEKEGILSTDDLVLDFFPEYKEVASEGSEKIKVENLLMMTSGHIEEDFSRYNQIDRAELFFTTEVKEKPGSKFFYEDLCSYMLGRIIEKLSGVNLLEYLKPRLFHKLGIINPQWHTCQLGHTSCGGGLYLRMEEFSRIGVLLLNKGRYNNEQIIDESYVQRMKAEWVDTSFKMDSESRQGYGYQIWKCTIPETYRADGMYGQFCVILEEYNAVVTVTGHNEDWPKDTLRAIWNDIIPCL